MLLLAACCDSPDIPRGATATCASMKRGPAGHERVVCVGLFSGAADKVLMCRVPRAGGCRSWRRRGRTWC